MNKENLVVIDPVTRLEGHGKISIYLNDQGSVDKAFFQVPELRGFEKFVEGMPVEGMPRVTQRICGVCPTAHHMAATKALDDLFRVEPPPAAPNRGKTGTCRTQKIPRQKRWKKQPG